MKLRYTTLAFVAATSADLLAAPAGAFVVVEKPRFGITTAAAAAAAAAARNTPRQLFATSSNNENENTAAPKATTTTTVCDLPTDIEPVGDFVSQKGSGKLLRSAVLTDVNGNQIKLGDKMGSTTTSTSIVVFLRHLG